MIAQVDPGRVLDILILTFSGIAAGGAFALLFAPKKSGLVGRDLVDRIALDCSRLGFAIMVMLISEAVARAGRVDTSDWRVYVYLTGAMLAGAGYLTLVIRGIVTFRRQSKK